MKATFTTFYTNQPIEVEVSTICGVLATETGTALHTNGERWTVTYILESSEQVKEIIGNHKMGKA